jgi:hypothetical protein
MSFTYNAVAGGTTMRSGHRYVGGVPNDTYTRTRAFLKFNLSPLALTLAQIGVVTLRVYAKTVFSGPTIHRLRFGDAGDNWGALIDATDADWLSTDVYIEEEKLVNATGWWEFVVDKNHLNLSGMNYFRIATLNETAVSYEYVDWYSQNSAINKPVLRICSAVAAFVPRRPLSLLDRCLR